jgi:hypothetical protein
MIPSGWLGGDHVAVDPAELATEQEYFDRAAAELEKFLANLATAPAGAALQQGPATECRCGVDNQQWPAARSRLVSRWVTVRSRDLTPQTLRVS